MSSRPNVAVTYSKGADAASSLVKEIERAGGKAIAIQADAADADAVRDAVKKTVATFGRLDVLVNNAGTAIPKPFEEATLEEMDRVIDINIRGVLVATQAALKHMKSGGRIIMIGSAVGERVVVPGLVPYSATKGAVKMFTQALAREIGSRGITVNNVQPGPINTELNPAAGDWAVPRRPPPHSIATGALRGRCAGGVRCRSGVVLHYRCESNRGWRNECLTATSIGNSKRRTIMNEFQGKVALVTGGTSGIGRAAAIAYAREGAKVVVAGRRAAEGEETVRLMRAQGGEGLFVPTDVAQEAQVKNLVARTLEQFGQLDFAFNNAGVDQQPTPLLEQTVETYERVMDINVKGVWLSMRHEIPAMLKSGGGAIVNTSSVAGVIAFPGIEVYAASKHAVIGLTKSAAVKFGKQGIRINAVLPAAIETDMYRRFVGEKAEASAAMTAMHPIGRIGTSEEIADAVIWLSSSKSSFVIGHRLLVDGGYTAQ